jgi:putative protein kinase ArgK-like GTPase of G3E family
MGAGIRVETTGSGYTDASIWSTVFWVNFVISSQSGNDLQED